jgi:endonuclease/exonuclease/phosphatase (EEP) superfamily protein YafD
VAGDFNATLDNRELRRLLDRGCADAAERAGAGLRATCSPRPRRALPIVIDHVLVDRRVRVRHVTVEDIPGSDHRAVIAELTLPAR